MYFVYLWEVLKRAFTPTSRVTDMLQILAASALPAASKFVGIKLPQDANSNALAYIGLIALSFALIRIFWAPYSIWKEQEECVGGLKLELSSPERQVIVHLARHRAKARIALAAKLEDFQTNAYAEEMSDTLTNSIAYQMADIRRLQASSGLSNAFEKGRGWLLVSVQNEAIQSNAMLPQERKSDKILKLLQRNLLGDLTAEDLALQLTPDIAPRTPR